MTTLVTNPTTKRIIYFIGHPKQNKSVLICKVCKNYETFLSIITGECATRTLLNLYNLHAVRGCLNKDSSLVLESSMSGPHHYFGWLDPEKVFVIKKVNCKLQYFQTKVNVQESKLFNLLPYDILTVKGYTWIDGKSLSDDVRDQYGIDNDLKHVMIKDGTVDSLFEDPGILLLKNKKLQLPLLKYPHRYDLSSFKAQVVKNDSPFSFNQNLIKKYKHAQHKLRVITYNYGSEYVDNYLMKGSGIFIERHEFIQAITPCNEDCGGFVILGREVKTKNKKYGLVNKRLELIAVPVPYGYTLLVDVGSIHGDSTLTGLYMMAMTGDHNAMKTADTVFLKDKKDKSNVEVVLDLTDLYENKNLNNNNLDTYSLDTCSLDTCSLDTCNYIKNITKKCTSSKDLLLTSDSKSLKKLYTDDVNLKAQIWADLNFVERLYWNAVIYTPVYLTGWDKTGENGLPDL